MANGKHVQAVPRRPWETAKLKKDRLDALITRTSARSQIDAVVDKGIWRNFTGFITDYSARLVM